MIVCPTGASAAEKRPAISPALVLRKPMADTAAKGCSADDDECELRIIGP